jgi:CO/xanthine dehydrogenase Mo-binding subunit
MNDQGIGAPARRKEYFRFLTRAHNDTDDFDRRGQHTEALGVLIEMVYVVRGDTGRILFDMGTYASCSLAVGGSALVKAINKVVGKRKKTAARARCRRKPLSAHHRQELAGIRDCRNWGSR